MRPYENGVMLQEVAQSAGCSSAVPRGFTSRAPGAVTGGLCAVDDGVTDDRHHAARRSSAWRSEPS